MIAKKLKLTNFRNYEKEIFEFDEKINIIHGNNAQGKTNILEALYMFSLGRSSRASHDSDMIKFGESFAEIEMDFISKDKENNSKIRLFRGKRKKIENNDIPVKRNSELAGIFNVVYFGPEYLGLVKDGPKKRRRNTDIMISQLRCGYLSAISDLRKLTEQKSVILKNDRIDENLLSVLNERVIELSETVIRLRYEYIKKTENIAKIIQNDISGGEENIEMNYISCGMRIGNEEIENLGEILKKKCDLMSEKERKYRECIFGPHRDDIEFKINGNELKTFGSQGQQKTCVLVQKIAEVELFRSETGEYPVLLLDDIMSELDKKRQEYVLNKLENMQIFITCTEKERFEKLKKGRILHIEKGRLDECISI